jgi:hypothetical protein
VLPSVAVQFFCQLSAAATTAAATASTTVLQALLLSSLQMQSKQEMHTESTDNVCKRCGHNVRAKRSVRKKSVPIQATSLPLT